MHNQARVSFSEDNGHEQDGFEFEGFGSIASSNELTVGEQLEHLFEDETVGFIAHDGEESAARTPLTDSEVALRKRTRIYLKLAIFAMLLSGSCLDFFAKSIYTLVPGVDKGVSGLYLDRWLTLVLTFASFISCALPPTFKAANRLAVYERLNVSFLSKLLAPSLMDLIVTGLRFIALVFLSPAVVTILKSTVQLVTLAFLNSLRGKKLSRRQKWSVLGAIIGDIVISFADAVSATTNPDEMGNVYQQATGIIIITISGVLGAVRNIIEEVILQEDNFPDGALLMFESWISAILVLLVGLSLGIVTQFEDVHDTWQKVQKLEVIVFFVLFCFAAYGKDAGKFKVVKYASSMVAKILALIFPCGTWGLSLVAHLLQGAIGEPWKGADSFVRLVGFVMVVVSGCVFVKKKK